MPKKKATKNTSTYSVADKKFLDQTAISVLSSLLSNSEVLRIIGAYSMSTGTGPEGAMELAVKSSWGYAIKLLDMRNLIYNEAISKDKLKANLEGNN